MNVIINFINNWGKINICISEKENIQIIKETENNYKIIEYYYNEKFVFNLNYEKLLGYTEKLYNELNEIDIEKL